VKTVAILGFAPSYVDAPFDDARIDVWTMNYHHEAVKRSSRVFELHEWTIVQGEDGGTHLRTLAALTVPVYMQTEHPEVPMSVAYPLDQMCNEFKLPHTEKAYFTNTASYMIAMAITEHYDEIQLYGIDMSQDTEYATQRPSCEYFLGIAVGRGIRVIPHRSSDVLKTAFLYGYEDEECRWLRDKLTARRAHLERMQAHHEQEMLKHRDALHQFAGALQDNAHMLKVL